jgi:hypothetical protein
MADSYWNLPIELKRSNKGKEARVGLVMSFVGGD